MGRKVDRRYFESAERFYEIWREGARVLQRHGLLGSRGETSSTGHGTVVAAREQHALLLSRFARRGSGYHAVERASAAPPAVEVAVTPGLIGQLRRVIIWLGAYGHQQAIESGDSEDNELAELASSYWTGLSHQLLFAALVLRLPENVHAHPDVQTLIRDGFLLYEHSFVTPSRVNLKSPPTLRAGGQTFTLSISCDAATAKRARALIAKRRA